MSVIKMAEQIKQIHPNYLLIFKVGAFCLTYGKDSYIIAANFNYILDNLLPYIRKNLFKPAIFATFLGLPSCSFFNI